jgi:NAD(P)-dependent dehydrogenase (short-subunit alcohol dehydrogenase family)
MRVLVTGAAGGIGSAIADSFEAGGHTVFRHDVRPSEDMDVVGDLLQPEALSEVTRFIDSSAVDTVVAAHGLPGSASLTDVSPEFTTRIMRVNTVSIMRLYDEVGSLLARRDGVFVLVSSQAGLVGEAQNGVYSASKFALVGWAQGLGRDTSGGHPRIRVICPGITETPLLVDAFQGMADASGRTYEQVLATRLEQVPGGRLGRPAEIGRACVWLAQLRQRDTIVAAVNGGEVLV